MYPVYHAELSVVLLMYPRASNSIHMKNQSPDSNILQLLLVACVHTDITLLRYQVSQGEDHY